MQTYYETETEVSENLQVTVQLPKSASPGKVKVRITYESENGVAEAEALDEKDKGMAEFLATLPLNHEGGLSLEEIQARIKQER